MNRSTLFALGVAAAAIFLIIAIVYLTGGPLGRHIKHSILFFALAIIAGLFAVMNRPLTAVR